MSNISQSGWAAPVSEMATPLRIPGQRVDPPDGAADDIRLLASTGFSKIGIAEHFGVSLSTLNRWLDDDDALQDAFTFGRDAERYTLHNALYRKACNGDSVAAMFLLKSRHGYREGDQQDQANKVSITFNLPGAVSADEYKVINGSDTAKSVSAAFAIDTGRI
jgi:hypothetical protein